jgi:hypothetical protein
VSNPQNIDFAPAVLGSLHVLVPSGTTEADLALELGLSAWMRVSGIDLDEARSRMWDIREAVLDAGELDVATEPIPLGGRSSRLDLLGLALYLARLVERATAHLGCDRETMLDRAMPHPALRRVHVGRSDVQQLRSS